MEMEAASKNGLARTLPKGILTMEQKKTLWIVAATGIFLLVVFGAALIINSKPLTRSEAQVANAPYNPETGWVSPRQGATPVPNSGLAFNTETPAASQEGNSSLSPSPFTNTTAESDGTKEISSPLHTDKVTVISDNATVYSTETTTIDLNSLKASSNSGIVAKNEMTANQIDANKADEQAQPKNEYASSARQENYYTPAPTAKAPVTVAKTPAPKASASAPKATKTATAKANTTPSKATTAAKVATSAKKTPDTYWVQAAAYTSKRNADEARTTLESNKIPSEVFTFTDSNGKTFYRVRVGPYVTKSEAEYWQTRIGMIDKFASAKSVIVNTAIN